MRCAKSSPNVPGSAASPSPEHLRALALYKLEIEAKMQAFDRLPKTVRAVLTASQFNWNVEQLYQTWRKKRMTARQLVRHVKVQDAGRLRERRI